MKFVRLFPAVDLWERASHLTGVAMNSRNRGKNVLPIWSVLLVLFTVTAVASAQKPPKPSAPAPHASAPHASAPSRPAPSAPHSAPAQRPGGSSNAQRPGERARAIVARVDKGTGAEHQ